ncbi:Gfo/Idh/MocA family protein [Pectobacterium carotovorum]|uniref:Gfo/Idh/MocA family protein n=1 Tax=Pectobacterium carotovorum TaxID=554 RepID=UPI00381F7166
MKIGIVGSGNIVKACLEAINKIDSVSCEAIVVREESKHKGEQLIKEFSINKLYTDYSKFITDPDIDIVYIGITNDLHYEYALLALNANKNVICEKPFTSDYSELLNLSKIAREKRLFLFEAITTIHSSNFKYIKDNISELGDVKLVQCNYSQYSSRYQKYLDGIVLPSFDPAMSGGSLYDINIYNIHFTCAIFGMPLLVKYHANRGFNGIDTSGVLVLIYPSFVAVCCGAKDSVSPSYATIQGTNGYLKLIGSPNMAKSVECYIDGELSVIDKSAYKHYMVDEFIEFYSMFVKKDYSQCYEILDHSLVVLSVLTEARKQVTL